MKKILVVFLAVLLFSFVISEEIEVNDDLINELIRANKNVYEGFEFNGITKENKNQFYIEEGILRIRNKNLMINLSSIPEDVKEILYKDGSFVYKFDDGEIVLGRGMIDSKGYFIDEELKAGREEGERRIKFDLKEKGIIEINEEGIFSIENGAVVEVGDRKFSSKVDESGSLEIDANKFKVNNLVVETQRLNLSIPDLEEGEFFSLNFEEPTKEEYLESENGIWIYEKNELWSLKVKGDNVEIELNQDWIKETDKISNIYLQGEGKNILFNINDVEFEIDGEKTFIPSNPSELEKLKELGAGIVLNNINNKDKNNEAIFFEIVELKGIIHEELDVDGFVKVSQPNDEVCLISSENRVFVGECIQLVDATDEKGNIPRLTRITLTGAGYEFINERYVSDTETARTSVYLNPEQLKRLPEGLTRDEFLQELVSNEKIDMGLGVLLTLEKLPPGAGTTTEGAQALRGYTTKEEFLKGIRAQGDILEYNQRNLFNELVDSLAQNVPQLNYEREIPGRLFGSTKVNDKGVIFKGTSMEIYVPGEGRGNPYVVFKFTEPAGYSRTGQVTQLREHSTIRVDAEPQYHGLLRTLFREGIQRKDRYDEKPIPQEWRGAFDVYQRIKAQR